MNTTLWNTLSELKSEKYKWVDLTHELSPETPHWYGFKPLEGTLLFDYMPGTPDDMMAPMRCIQYSVASQYGTHVDAPRHFHEKGRTMAEIGVKELVYPLVVIDKSAECAANPDFMLKVEDIQKWEEQYGRIPEGDIEAIKWLVENRSIGAIGHEPADTDPATVTTKEGAYPYPGEQYILEVDRFQIEVMRNLDQCPPVGGIIVCSFPRLRDGVGFPARCFAIVPNE